MLITQPVVLERTPADLERTAPGWGEHSEEVLSEAGYSSDDIARFRDEGVV